MKPCNRCDEWLPLSAYYADRRNSDGRQGACKGCERERQRAAYQRKHGLPEDAWRLGWRARNEFGQFARAR